MIADRAGRRRRWLDSGRGVSYNPLVMSRFYLALMFAFCANGLAAESPRFEASEHLDKVARQIVTTATERFGKGGLTSDKIALTIIDLADCEKPAWANYQGEEPTYPASVVKLFYLAAAYHQLEANALPRTPELERALHDMIVDSSNDATHYVVDVLTGTTGVQNCRTARSPIGWRSAT